MTIQGKPIGRSAGQGMAELLAKPPRTWAAMLDAWGALLGDLCSFLPPAEADQGRRLRRIAELRWQHGALGEEPLERLAWLWMWSLPPCSEARKAAFTLGRAALAIERWRSCVTMVPFRPDDGFPICEGWMVGPDDGKTTLQTSAESARALPEAQILGLAAEYELRMAAWHIDDARGERAGIELHAGPGPSVPRHESVYKAGFAHVYEAHEGINFTSSPSGKRGAHMILHHHLGRGQPPKIQVTDALLQRFGETAVSSLPDGPWVMTSRDVCQFLAMLLEDAELLQDGEPVRDVTASEYEAHCKRHEPPPLGCETHHPAGERCCDTCAFPDAPEVSDKLCICSDPTCDGRHAEAES